MTPPHLNALHPVRLDAAGLPIVGFSISGLATWLLAPTLGVAFDMGECPLEALSIDHVLLTHAHGDHARCVPRHWQLRRMIGNPRPGRYLMPAALVEPFADWIRAEARFEGVRGEVSLPELVGLAPGDVLPLRDDLRVTAFAASHTVVSLGYTVSERRKKLKAELEGWPGDKLAALRRRGVTLHEDRLFPKITFIGDCVASTLLEEAHIWRSPVLVLETTFVEPHEEPLAAPRGHTHLNELAAVLREIGDAPAVQALVLKHFSMRTDPARARALIQTQLPESWRSRVLVLLPPEGLV
jgi:ribonuclease Z